ncbi:CLUMA_CG009353, isoform A [Clunio marinus]|uniref:CLUMA_CG009353, isoform A n=1 Tax=Clunio marinus TaxID=568069 RepID=A0A1J1I6U1_9DIPT|nr:CLUMA_CG009353, isoform A [Clunio marinus]
MTGIINGTAAPFENVCGEMRQFEVVRNGKQIIQYNDDEDYYYIKFKSPIKARNQSSSYLLGLFKVTQLIVAIEVFMCMWEKGDDCKKGNQEVWCLLQSLF